MIHVKFYSNGELELRVQGHAGQDEPGKDIVCASASILLYTVAQSVLDMEQLGYLKTAPTVDTQPGNAIVRCCPKSKHRAKVKQVYTVVHTGYQLLAENYPQYVALTTFGKAKA